MTGQVKIPGVFKDIAKVIPEWKPEVIFDVGANIGQSALAYNAAFPEAAIHSFEPVPATFELLQTTIAHFPNVTPHHVALGKAEGTVRMTAEGTKTTNKIVSAEAEGVIEVPAATGASYMRRLGVAGVSYLKIDTEGHDYNVLIGFLPVIKDIDFIQVEAAMNIYNKTHVQFRVIEDLLRQEGFYLFRIYDQVLEFKRGGRPVLRRANPVFINGSMFDLSKID